jgi:hypothetical protein
MKVSGHIQVTCPYCQFMSTIEYETTPRPFVALCDVDSGGCDTYFVVTSVNVDVHATTARIEGEQA